MLQLGWNSLMTVRILCERWSRGFLLQRSVHIFYESHVAGVSKSALFQVTKRVTPQDRQQR